MSSEEIAPLTLEDEALEMFRKIGQQSSSDRAVTQKNTFSI